VNRLVLDRVTKRYANGHETVRDVSLDLAAGVCCLVGKNGAGKSTLLRMLATVDRATSGTIRWNGIDVARAPGVLRRSLGYLPQDAGVYPSLSAPEFLMYVAALKGIGVRFALRQIGELIEYFGLGEVRSRPLGAYSGGMRQRVGIAQALLGDPQLLIFDEPTAGLDADHRARFLQKIAGARDRIVILSTHLAEDVAAVADRVAIVEEGRLRTCAS
jgi:ABC-2 type transport system ATP-binding protein